MWTIMAKSHIAKQVAEEEDLRVFLKGHMTVVRNLKTAVEAVNRVEWMGH